MKIEFSPKEKESAETIVAEANKIKSYQHEGNFNPVEFYYEVKPSSIGCSIILIIPEFNIRKDITDFGCF